jgi:hypothetical protein
MPLAGSLAAVVGGTPAVLRWPQDRQRPAMPTANSEILDSGAIITCGFCRDCFAHTERRTLASERHSRRAAQCNFTI